MKRAAADRHWLFADQHIAREGAPNNFAKDAIGVGHGICAADTDETLMKFSSANTANIPANEMETISTRKLEAIFAAKPLVCYAK
jgi:hypothetical protein